MPSGSTVCSQALPPAGLDAVLEALIHGGSGGWPGWLHRATNEEPKNISIQAQSFWKAAYLPGESWDCKAEERGAGESKCVSLSSQQRPPPPNTWQLLQGSWVPQATLAGDCVPDHRLSDSEGTGLPCRMGADITRLKDTICLHVMALSLSFLIYKQS